MKMCTKCKREFPATLEYFKKDSKVKSGLYCHCKECVKEEQRKYYLKNREHIIQQSKEYYENNREDRNIKSRQYYQDNKEKLDKINRQWVINNRERHIQNQHNWYMRNRDKVRERSGKWYINNRTRGLKVRRAYYENNKERAKLSNDKWRVENPELVRSYTQNYRNKKSDLPHTLTIDEYNETLSYFNNSCAYCGMTETEHIEVWKEKLHQDHIVPLSKGGGYTKENIIPSCKPCNSSKSNLDIHDWYNQQKHFNINRYNKILEFIEK